MSQERVEREPSGRPAVELPESPQPVDAMMAAFEAGDVDRVRALVDEHPEVLAEKGPGGIPLPLAALYHGREDLARLLLDLGAPLHVHAAAALGRVDALAAMLDRRQASVRDRSADGWTPLHLAAYFGRRAAVTLLIERGADLRARSANAMENTPLHAAVAGGRMAVVMLLVERGADVNAEAAGVAPLDIACGRRDDEMVRYLVDRGAEKACKGGNG